MTAILDRTLTADDLVTQWALQHFARLKPLYSPVHLKNFAEAGIAVGGMDPAILKTIADQIDPTDRGSVIGPLIKDGENGKDHKFMFHFHHTYAQRVSGRPALKDPRIATFVSSGMELLSAAVKMVGPVFQALDGRFPGIKEKFLPGGVPANFYLRFVAYRYRPGKALARAHYDTSPLTLAMGTSGPGLEFGTGDDNLAPLDYDPTKMAICFPGYPLWEITDGDPHGPFIPGWHVVKPYQELVKDVPPQGSGDDFVRWAVVMFCAYPGMLRGTEDEIYTPYSYRTKTL